MNTHARPTCDQMDRDLEQIRRELETERADMDAARAASPSGGGAVWCSWCDCFEDDPRCNCPNGEARS